MAAFRQVLLLATLFCSLLHHCTASEQPDCTHPNSYLWKVETTPPVYLFGTMHVPYNKLWDHIPTNVKTAFSSCDEVCLEIVLSDQDTRDQLIACQYLPGSVASIEDALSKGMVARIADYLESVKKVFPKWIGASPLLGASNSDAMFDGYINDWRKKRPIWILMMLSALNEEQVRNRNIPLLDEFLENVANELKKDVQPMETTREQCRGLNKLDNSHVEVALRVQLDHLEAQLAVNELSTNQQSDILSYRCGDFAHLVSTTPILPLPPLASVNKTSPTLLPSELAVLESVQTTLWNQLVVRRNRRMSNAINTVLGSQRNKTMFIALGAGHYLSENSVVDRLVKKGHSIVHLSASEAIEGPSLPSNAVQLGDSRLRQVDLGAESEHTPHKTAPTLTPQDHSRIWDRLQNPVPVETTPPDHASKDHDVHVREADHSGTSSIYSNIYLTTTILLIVLSTMIL